jgi:hypothetical protein
MTKKVELASSFTDKRLSADGTNRYRATSRRGLTDGLPTAIGAYEPVAARGDDVERRLCKRCTGTGARRHRAAGAGAMSGGNMGARDEQAERDDGW